jgi:hypothetical protein
MEFLAIVAFLVVVLAVYVISNADRNRSHSQLQSSSETVDAYAEEDKRFDDAILKKMGSNLAGHFYTKIVGITFKNKDGVTREKLIPTCKPFEPLDLVSEPANSYDPNAIAVHKKGGPQLGYLNSSTAEEVATSMKKHGAVWQACVKLAKPKTKDRHGCLVICLMEMTKNVAEPTSQGN